MRMQFVATPGKKQSIFEQNTLLVYAYLDFNLFSSNRTSFMAHSRESVKKWSAYDY